MYKILDKSETLLLRSVYLAYVLVMVDKAPTYEHMLGDCC